MNNQIMHSEQSAGTGGTSQTNDAARRDQPEYGQYAEPEYGEMANRYPNWNPYVYGAPEPEKPKDGEQAQQGQQLGQQPQMPQSGAGLAENGQFGNPQNQWQSNGYPNNYPNGRNPYMQSPVPGDPNDRSRYRNGIDLDDPVQNPLYGHWDPAAICSFVMALIGVPILPLALGLLAMWRTKLFRMKGRGLAIAAVVISLLMLGLEIYMMMAGIDTQQLIAQLYGLDLSGDMGGESTSV